MIRVVLGDITGLDVDAVVNAANPGLMGGGGVDGAIHRAGGPAILTECREIRRTMYPRGLPTGEAVATTGGALRARHVIHTVGPVWRGGGSGEAELLRRAYRSSMRIVAELGLESVAFPCISAGAYGYPVAEASRVAVRSIREFIAETGWSGEVLLVAFTARDYGALKAALEG
jgi:O-acetyl-ADP-ribose deacetylase (regulator of RNase III)